MVTYTPLGAHGNPLSSASSGDPTAICPYRIRLPQAAIDDINKRVLATR